MLSQVPINEQLRHLPVGDVDLQQRLKHIQSENLQNASHSLVYTLKNSSSARVCSALVLQPVTISFPLENAMTVPLFVFNCNPLKISGSYTAFDDTAIRFKSNLLRRDTEHT